MYKAGQSAVARTVIPSIQHKRRPTSQPKPNYSHIWRTPEEKILLTTLKVDGPLFSSDVQLSLFPRKKRREPCSLTPPSTPSSPLVEEQIEFLHTSWRSFRETAAGEMDTKVVTYHASEEKEIPEDFEPFNIDRFLAEKLLKELDIDPKFALF